MDSGRGISSLLELRYIDVDSLSYKRRRTPKVEVIELKVLMALLEQPQVDNSLVYIHRDLSCMYLILTGAT